MGLGQIWDTQISPNRIKFEIEFTSSQTDNNYRYRGRVKIWKDNYNAVSYSSSNYYTTSQSETFILPAVFADGFSVEGIQNGNYYNCQVIVEYYNQNASQYGWRQSSTSRTTFSLYIPTAEVTASVLQVTDSTATIKVGFKTDCYNGDIFYVAYVEKDANDRDAAHSDFRHIYSTGNNYSYFDNVVLTDLQPNTTYNVTAVVRSSQTANVPIANTRYIKTASVSFTTAQVETGNGYWSDISVVQSIGSTAINYSATWTSTWADSISWQLAAYLDTDNNSNTRLKIETATLSNGRDLTISGTTSNVSLGSHTIYFHAYANGPDGGVTSRSITITQSFNYDIDNIVHDLSTSPPTLRWNFITNDFNQTYRGRISFTIAGAMHGSRYSDNLKITNSSTSFYFQFPMDYLGSYQYTITMQKKIVPQSQEQDTYWADLVSESGSFNREQSQINLLKWSWGSDDSQNDIAWSGSWNSSETNTTRSTTSAAYTAITSHGATTNFNHAVWNDLIDWVVYNLEEIDANYSSQDAADAKMNSSPYILTARKYNSFAGLVNTLWLALGGSNNILTTNWKTGEQVNGIGHFRFPVQNLNLKIRDYS